MGDMAETVALLWPTSKTGQTEFDESTIRISDAVERLKAASRLDAPHVLASMLDHLDSSGGFALLKLATGELRVEVDARLAKPAFADAFDLEVEDSSSTWLGWSCSASSTRSPPRRLRWRQRARHLRRSW